MSESAIIGLTMYVIVSIYISCHLIVYFIEDPDECWLSPRYLYETSNMNIIGVILIFITVFALAPLYYIVVFIYWVCHIGRR